MDFCNFTEKEVINVRNCKKLGHVVDLEFDECNGCIHKIIVKPKFSFSTIFCDEKGLCIPYRDIKQIGAEIILVDIC